MGLSKLHFQQAALAAAEQAPVMAQNAFERPCQSRADGAQGYEGLLSKDTRKTKSIKTAAKDEYLFSLSSATSDVVRPYLPHLAHVELDSRTAQPFSASYPLHMATLDTLKPCYA